MSSDTIAAISTPPGRGGIGIVRLSGEEAREVAARMLRLRHPMAAGRARFGELLEPKSGEPLDQVVVTFFAAPHSSTGEDVVEIAAHGSPVLLQHMLELCVAGGARLAEPGEFTQRGFLNGRMDLTQAEAVHDLIESSTLHQARVAARQLGGSLARRLAPLKQQVVSLIAALEAGIDFAEDDLETLPGSAIEEALVPVRESLMGLAATWFYGRVLREGLTLAIVGRPNAGKSSLFNRLVERERAIVTSAPGTTRDTIAERVSIGGIPVELVDTAGLRGEPVAVSEAEALGIARSWEAIAEADLILLVRDASESVTKEDAELLASMQRASGGREILLVENKYDLVQGALRDWKARSSRAGHAAAPVRTSALTGDGIAELREAILTRLKGEEGQAEDGLITSLRQHLAVSAAAVAIEKAARESAAGTPHEMVLLDLYETLGELDSLTGTTSTEEILQRIFATFCIGK